MNEQVILTIAEAVLANTRILQALVDSLPREAQERVERKVTEKKVKDSPAPAPVATVEIPTPALAPAPVVAAPVVPPVQPAPTPPAPAMATPTPAPAPVQPAPAAATPSSACPITDKSSLTKYVMDRYRALGAVRGGQIQGCLDVIGVKNINDIKPEQYQQFWTSVEALQ